MHPAYINDMSWAMAEVYASVTDQLLINLARHFPYVQDREVHKSFEYQAQMLAQMGQVNQESIAIIMQNLGNADDALRACLEKAILDAVKSEDPKLAEAARRGLLHAPAQVETTPSMMQAFKVYYKQSADKLNLVNTVMLESTQAAYAATVSDIGARIATTQRILNTSTGQVVSGVTAYNQAVHDAVKKMVANGLTGFVDHGGHRWSPEAYVAMDIKTTMMNTGRAAVLERNAEYGNDLYQVSSHNGARPLCYPWQGKVISTSGRTGTTEDLDGNKVEIHSESEIESFKYGGGLFGVNCGHYPMCFIPGLSTLKGEPQDPEENEKAYAESQEQRRLERKLREEKRDLEVMKAQGASPEAIQAQKEKVKQASADIDDFCDETGRTRKRNRERAPVNATWPDKTTYDPANFPTQERDKMRDWFKNGGTAQNVASQATPTVPNDDIFKNVKGLDDAFKKGMAQTLNGSGRQEAQKLYAKFADELVCKKADLKKGAYFSSWQGGIFMNTAKDVAGSSYQAPYEVCFHEFGHMIDWLAGGKNPIRYLSNTPHNGRQLLDVIKSDFRAFKKTCGVSTAKGVIPILQSEKMDLRTCGNISDILEKCTGVSYPLGIGHGAKYHKQEGATEKEFFAEVLDSAVTNPAGYAQMQRLFPNAVNLVWDMIGGVI